MSLDPFFDEFHRLYPKIPIVLLPPQAPAPDVEEVPDEVADARAHAAVDDAGRLLRQLWPVLAAGRPAPSTATIGWVPDRPGVARVKASVRLEGPVASPGQEVAAVGQAMADLGWSARGRDVDTGGLRMVATRDHLAVEVVAWGPEGPWDVAVAARALLGSSATRHCSTASSDVAWALLEGGDQ